MFKSKESSTKSATDRLGLAAALLMATVAVAYHPEHLEPVRIKGAIAALGVGALCLGAAMRKDVARGASRAIAFMLLACGAWGWIRAFGAPVDPRVRQALLLHHSGIAFALVALLGIEPRSMLRPFLVVLPVLATLPFPRFWDGIRSMGAAAGNPNVLAASILPWIPIALVRARGKRIGHWALAVMLIVLVAQRSEAALGGLVVALLVQQAFADPRHPRTSLLAALAAFGSAAAAWALFVRPAGTALVRRTIWRGALSLVEQAPRLGQGLGSFTRTIQAARPPESPLLHLTANTGHAHCEALEVAAELGIVGLGLLAMLALLLIRRAMRDRDEGDEKAIWRAALLAGIAGVAVDGLASPNLRWFSVALPFWGMVGVLGALGAPSARAWTPTRIGRAAILAPIGLVALFLGARELRFTLGTEGELLAAERHLIHGRPAEALPHLERARIVEPRSPRLLYRIGIAHERLRAWTEAVSAYEDLHSLDPLYARLPLHLSFALLRAGRPGEARMVAAGAAPLCYDDELWGVWGESVLDAGDTTRALAIVDRMLDLHERWPDDSGGVLPFLSHAPLHELLATRANLLSISGQRAEARRDYREAIRKGGPRDRLLARIGASYSEEGRRQEADLVERALIWTMRRSEGPTTDGD